MDYIVLNQKEIPEDLIREAEGTTICKWACELEYVRSRQIGYRVLPPQGFFDPAVLGACNTLYTRAEEKLGSSTDVSLQQRVTVYEIPCARAIGNWKGKRGGFFVYGNNRTCFCPRYRQDFYGSCSFLLSVSWIKHFLCYSSFTKESLETVGSGRVFSRELIRSTVSRGAIANS